MSQIELKHIDKFYGNNHVLRDINLTIEDGAFMTLLGPSGCGKTTTLRMISGLEDITSGDLYMGGKRVNEVESGDRMELNLSGQEYGLLAEGDRGKLTFQGTRYLGFEREL